MSKRSLLTVALVLCAVAPPVQALVPLWSRTGFSEYMEVRKIVAADFNGDGQADVAIRNHYQIYLFLMVPGEPVYANGVLIHTGTSSLSDLLAADATGDGKPDIILSDSYAKTVTVLPSQGDGSFRTPIVSSVAVQPWRLAWADFDGDGNIDLAIRSSFAVALYVGDGAGHFTVLLNTALTHTPSVVEAADIDNDGNGDYVVGYSDSVPYDVYFSNGDGRFTSVPLSVIPDAERMALADLDADGDREILIPHYDKDSLTVIVNSGGRAFATPVVHPSMTPPSPFHAGSPFDIAVGDFNEDGDADVVMTLASRRLIGTYTGNGDGSLNPGVFVHAGAPRYSQSSPQHLAIADFSGDGRLDIALAARTFIALWKNVTGEVDVTMAADYATITAGQTVTFTLNVANSQGAFSFSEPPPAATGSVSLEVNGVEIGSSPLTTEGTATIEIDSLSLGAHAITAHYEGDDLYRPAESAAVQVNVIEESTTVTLSSSAAGTDVPYGTPFTLTASVVSEVPGSIDGVLSLYRDGLLVTSQPAPSASFQETYIPAGTHAYHVTYSGSAIHPPTTSAEVTQVVRKATSATTLLYAAVMRRYTGQGTVRVGLTSEPNGLTGGGNIHLYEGSTLLATVPAYAGCCVGPGAGVDLPVSLPIGDHDLHAVFDGNENFDGSTSSVMKYVIFPDTGFVIDAWTQGGSITVFSMYDPPGGGYLKAWIWVGGEPPRILRLSFPSVGVAKAVQGTPYVFRMEAYDASDQLVATSNTVLEMLLTDEPLQPGTRVKSVHLTELLAGANALRAVAALDPVAIDVAPGEVIRASHVLELRAAVNEALVALGGSSVSFTDEMLTGLPVKALHIQELRDAIH